MDRGPPGFSTRGTLQARVLERVGISSSKPSPRTRRQLHSPTQESNSSLLKVPGGGGEGSICLQVCRQERVVFVVTKR